MIYFKMYCIVQVINKLNNPCKILPLFCDMTIHIVGDGALERPNHHIHVQYGWVYVQRLLLEKILHR